MHLHSLPISAFLPRPSHTGRYFSLLLWLFLLIPALLVYSLSFSIPTNSQKALLSLAHTSFSSFCHSQKTTFLSLSLNIPSPWTTPRPFVTAVSLLKTTHVCPRSIPLLIKCSPPPQKHCSVGDTWLFVKDHPRLESHSDIWGPGHGYLSPPWEVTVMSTGAQPSTASTPAVLSNRAQPSTASTPCKILFLSDFDECQASWGSPSRLPGRQTDTFLPLTLLVSCPLTSAYISQAGGDL